MRRASIEALLGPAFVLYLIADAAASQGSLDRIGLLASAAAFALSLVRVWAAGAHDGQGGARVGWLSLALGLGLVRVAAPGALSLTVDVAQALALPAAAALLVDLALTTPDKLAGAGRLRRLRWLTYGTALAGAAIGCAALAPPVSLAGQAWLLPARWALAPTGLGLLSLATAFCLRVLRRRMGSGPEAMAGSAWAVIGLLPPLAVAITLLVAQQLHLRPSPIASRLALTFAALCLAWGHLKLVDPKERLRVGRAARDLVAGALTLAAVAAGTALLGPSLLPRTPLPLAAASLATLLSAAAAFHVLRALAQQVLSPFGGRLLGALAQAREELAVANSLQEVGGIVLRACRAGSGDSSAQPLLYVSDPALKLRIDLAGQPHVAEGALHGALAARIQADPGEIVMRAPLESQLVRQPSWRPLIDELLALDALCVVPLMQDAELEGALVVPRGLRRSALSLEELDALRRFGHYITGFLAVLSAHERAGRRAADSILQLRQARETVERLSREAADLEQQVKALRVNGATERLGDPLLSYSQSMRALLDKSQRLADTRDPLLLVAEGGVPLCPLAQHIHTQSDAQDAAFVVVDAASLPATSNGATLFDPGASESLWRLARGGSLLVLDLPALGPQAQAALAERLGEAADDPAATVRLIASARVGPEQLGERGLDDGLLERLRSVLEVPALRERPEDLPSTLLLAVDRACRQQGKQSVGIEAEARERLLGYHWPGNSVELASVIEQAVARCEGPRIALADLPTLTGSAPAREDTHPLDGTLENLERKVLRHAMRRARGNKSQAARLLGLPRTTLVDKLRRHGLDDQGARAAN